MTSMAILAAIVCLSLVLFYRWSLDLGIFRASLAGSCRLLWLSPLLCCLFPGQGNKELPRVIATQPLHVLLDDSDSMRQGTGLSSPSEQAIKILESIYGHCDAIGCLPRVSRLSELSDLVAKGYSPLNTGLATWLERTSGEPWILVSDGNDYQPSVPWASSLKNKGRSSSKAGDKEEASAPKGLILGFSGPPETNTWINHVEIPPFAFEQKPIHSEAVVSLSPAASTKTLIQVQVLLNQEILVSANAEFSPGDHQVRVGLPIASLPRGQHLLTFRALAPAEEKTIWDNRVHKQIEVMPDTVGVLHLLGSPGWDGRFLRRHLKSEPRYDLISFFILRDPWDTQGTNEREMSLIPFPVARLFNEELHNFRVIILQNFTLLQFLKQEYQENLVRFVKNGGGLLFLGGPRALGNSDIRNSPLREILPFETSDLPKKSGLPFLATIQEESADRSGPFYDPNQKFRIELAKPPVHKRALATVYDDWESRSGPLSRLAPLQGLHHMEKVHFKTEYITPLLNAATPSGEIIPLAAASYPGKGRAIWIFSDQFWKLAISARPGITREVYDRFFGSAMIWLLRQDLRKPLMISDFKLIQMRRMRIKWSAVIKGPAVPYLNSGKNWSIRVCGKDMKENEVLIRQTGNQQVQVSGTLDEGLQGGQRCSMKLTGEHPAFGSVTLSAATIFPPFFPDRLPGDSRPRLLQLASLTGAQLLLNPENKQGDILAWMDLNSKNEGIVLPKRYKTFSDFFWVFSTWWVWLLLLFIPLEILCRRWHLINHS